MTAEPHCFIERNNKGNMKKGLKEYIILNVLFIYLKFRCSTSCFV